MDNFSMKITSEGRIEFDMALKIFFNHTPGNKATHYKVRKYNFEGDDCESFIFYWHEDKSVEGQLTLPYEMKFNTAADFVWGWLESVRYPPKPDIDGDVDKGWYMGCDFWGHTDDSHYGFVEISPVWAMYGK